MRSGPDWRRGSGGQCALDLRVAALTTRYVRSFALFVEGVVGGFTIATGVVVEGAAGGAVSRG